MHPKVGDWIYVLDIAGDGLAFISNDKPVKVLEVGDNYIKTSFGKYGNSQFAITGTNAKGTFRRVCVQALEYEVKAAYEGAKQN